MESAEATVNSAHVLKAFYKFKNAYIGAIEADARLKYLDQGHDSVKKAWAKANQAEEEFKTLLRKAVHVL